MPSGRLMLRSRRPDPIRPDDHSLLTHVAIRQLMVEASRRAACDPDTLSFVRTTEIVRAAGLPGGHFYVLSVAVMSMVFMSIGFRFMICWVEEALPVLTGRMTWVVELGTAALLGSRSTPLRSVWTFASGYTARTLSSVSRRA
jgi:hypothetical protein